MSYSVSVFLRIFRIEHGSSAVSLDVLKQQYRGGSSKYTTQRFPAPGHGLLTALQTNEVM